MAMNEDGKAVTGWQAVGGLLRSTMLLSALLAIAAEALQHLAPLDGHFPSYVQGHDEGRLYYFLLIAYLTLIPRLTLRIKRLVENEPVPKSNLLAKLAMTAFCLTVMPAILLLPLLLVSQGPDTFGRSHALYVVVVQSLVGLCVSGGVMVYGFAITLWVLLFGIKNTWTKG